MPAYSFLDVTASLTGPGGTVSLGAGAGSAEEGITCDYLNPKGDMKGGADGQVMHSLRASKAGKITVRLLKTSPTNSILSAVYEFQSTSSSVWGRNTIVVRDAARGDYISGRESAFEKKPAIVFATDGNMNEWAFFVGYLDMNLGTGTPAILF